MANPIAPVLEGLRLCVADGHNLFVTIVQPSDGALVWTPLYLCYSAAWAVIGLCISGVVFHRSQYRFAEYV